MSVLYWKDGTPYEVPDENLSQALTDGFVQADPVAAAKEEAAQHPVRAALEGAVRGTSFGLSDPFMVGAGVDRQGLKLRKEENPVASTVGEIGGAVAPAVLTGGVSGAVGGGLRGAALESGLYGMGSMFSESALENKPLTSESLAAGFAGGALAGGVAHGGFTLLGKGISAGISKFGGQGMRDTLNKVADDVEWGGLKNGAGDKWGKLNEPFRKDILEFGKAQEILGTPGGAYNAKQVAKAKSVVQRLGDKMGEHLDILESAVPVEKTPQIRAQAADFVQGYLKEFENSPAHDDAMKTAQKYISNLRDTDWDWKKYWQIQSSLFKDGPHSTGASEVREKIRQGMRDFMFNEVASGENRAGSILTALPESVRPRSILDAPMAEPVNVNLSEQPISGPGVFSDPLRTDYLGAGPTPRAPVQMPAPRFLPQTVTLGEEAATTRGGLNIAMPEQKTPAWLGAEMRRTGKEYRMARALETAIEKNSNRLDKAGVLGGASSMGTIMALASGNPAPLIGGVIKDVAENQLKRRGGFIAASALRSLADSSVNKGIVGNLFGHVGQILSVAPELLGAYRFPLAQAAAKGADELLAEHMRLASGPQGHDYLAKVGLPVETPEQVDQAGQKLATLDAIQRHAVEYQASLSGSIDGMLGASPGRKPSFGAGMTPKQFETVMGNVREMLLKPEKAFEQIPPELHAVAPEVMSQTAATTLNMMKFLDSKAPKNPYEGMPPSVAPQWQPSAADIDKFNRYREAVEAPAQVLKNMANGYVSPEQVEALQAVYPAMYEDLRNKLSEKLMMWKKPLSFQQKSAIGIFLGTSITGMSPVQMQVLQQTQGMASGQDQGGGAAPKQDGRQVVDQEKNLQTQSQKLEAR